MADRLPPQPRRPLAADIPTVWLNAEWWQAFDADALAVYISALMWSMGQGTDGNVSLPALQRATPLWRDDARFTAAVAGIVAQGRGMVNGDRLVLDDWEGKHAQTLHARIVRRRATSAKSTAKHRDEHGDESRDESHTERQETAREGTAVKVKGTGTRPADPDGLIAGARASWARTGAA